MFRNKKGTVIWLTGLPCSGKTALSKKIEEYFIKKNKPIQRLDGDVLRRTINRDLGFGKEDRMKNIQRASHIAKMLSENGINVVAAFVTPYEKMREFTRSLCENYIEIYVKCELEECERRDVKGMYAKAQKGIIKDFTGVQDHFEEPFNAQLVVETTKESLAQSEEKIVKFLKRVLR